AAREKAIPAAKADGTARALALRAAKAKLDAASKAVDDFKMADVSALVNQQANLQAITYRHADLTSDIVNRTNEVARIKAAANVKLTEPNPWDHAVNGKRTEVMRNADQLLVVEPGVKAAQAGYDLLTDAVKVFGPAGVRAHVLDTVTPYLNERTRDYLGALADGNIHATWSTLSKTAKGELKEKFNIEVVNDKGADSFAGMSGGEKRKARLATSLALQDLVASRATKPIGLWIGDEIDHALDDAGLERLMGVLERKARDRGTVLVISHNALDQWCSEIITVTKNGGKASVTGAVAHGI
ncbi:MAG: SMC family ATPase, partial [Caulobacter sp.]|nr:SMC family ATPase [Vitreoscilla sp.]